MAPVPSPDRPSDVPLPWRFWCGAAYPWKHGWGWLWNSGWGYLTIAPERLLFEFPRIAQMLGAPPEVVHDGDEVIEVWPRLLLGFRAGIIINGEGKAVLVGAAGWGKRRAVHAAL